MSDNKLIEKEFRIGTRYQYSSRPLYMVLVYPNRKGKAWAFLKLNTGEIAYFLRPPSSYEEAIASIREKNLNKFYEEIV